MSVEARLDKLEEQHRVLDANLHSLAKVCAEVKNIALTNQHDIAGLKVDLAGLKVNVAGLEQCIAALAEATHAGFRRTDEKIDAVDHKVDQLELLIRQLIPSASN